MSLKLAWKQDQRLDGLATLHLFTPYLCPSPEYLGHRFLSIVFLSSLLTSPCRRGVFRAMLPAMFEKAV